VFIDYHRNTYAQTAVPPYAVRPRPGAPVAAPLAWNELDGTRPDTWNVRTMPDRLARTPGPWVGFGRHPRSIDRAVAWLARERRPA
jgi:bifunctional non-homologous end joining protein LigD